MTVPKTAALLEALREATERRSIEWEDTAAEDVFRTWIGDGIVKVGEFSAPSEDAPLGIKYYVAWVLNAKDDIVDEIEARPGQPGYLVLEQLYPLARRIARKADGVLDDMLKALKAK